MTASGKRERHFHPSRDAARDHAQLLKEKFTQHGSNAAAITPTLASDASKAAEILAPYNESLVTAARFYAAARQRDAASEILNDAVAAYLTEGPLDTARIGPGGIVLMGKSISQENAIKVAANFHLVISAFDNDKSGQEATDKISASLLNNKAGASILKHVEPLVISTGKDLGELDQTVANDILLATLKRAMRSL